MLLAKFFNRNLFIRSASGLVIIATLLVGTLYNEYSNFLLFSVIGLVSLYEMLSTLKPRNVETRKWFTIVLSLAILASFALFQFGMGDVIILYTVPIAVVLARFISEMFRATKSPAENIAYDLFSICYTIVPMLLLITLPPRLVVALLFIIWTNDIGAYVVGVIFGKHSLWKRLSPKKSWEGFFGGVIFAVLVATFTFQYADGFTQLSWTLTAAAIAVVGVLGDLFESMLKRSVEVKDSGNAIPGHGGFLDRFDALILATPLVWIIFNSRHLY